MLPFISIMMSFLVSEISFSLYNLLIKAVEDKASPYPSQILRKADGER
jgi:hypothetical protein